MKHNIVKISKNRNRKLSKKAPFYTAIANLDKIAVTIGTHLCQARLTKSIYTHCQSLNLKLQEKFESWLQEPETSNQMQHHSKNQNRAACKKLPLNKFVAYCITLPNVLFVAMVIIISSSGAITYEGIRIPTQESVPTIPLASVNTNELQNIINEASSLPITFSPKGAQNKLININTNPLEYIAITIRKSIFISAKKAGLAASMVNQFMSIFSNEVNFARDVHDGDKIVILYKKMPVKIGKQKKPLFKNEILAAELVKKNKSYRAIRFTDSNNRTSYYTPEGYSLKPSMTRIPINYRRISSKFSYHRWHPILGFARAHLGVDFSANIGTPIKAAGDGRVTFAGKKGDYGKVIIIQHDGKYSTLYAHLSGFKTGLSQGSFVGRDQIIGYSGNSGLSSGPHLHYEVRIYGIPRDPLSVSLPRFAIANGKDRAKFFSLAKTLLAQLRTNTLQYAANIDNTTNKQLPA